MVNIVLFEGCLTNIYGLTNLSEMNWWVAFKSKYVGIYIAANEPSSDSYFSVSGFYN